MKGVVIAALIVFVAASVIYAAPVLAYMNGATDQVRDRDQDRLRGETCSCDCLQAQNQICTPLRQQERAQNQTCDGSSNCQQYMYQYQYRFRHQNISPP